MIVVFGKTRSGKDTVAKYLAEKLDYSFIVTYTDRPIRSTELNGREHFFISTKEMNTLFDSDKVVLKTHIVDPVQSLKDRSYKGYRYCTKKEDLCDNSIVILDYNGIVELSKSGIRFTTIYVISPYKTRKERTSRVKTDLDIFNKRCRDEYSQFVKGVGDCADFVIDNNSTLEDLYSKIDEVIKCIRG